MGDDWGLVMGADKRRSVVGGDSSATRLAVGDWGSLPWLAWHRSFIAQQQWLLEWYLDLAVGALNPVHSWKRTVNDAPVAKPVRRAIGCIGPADLQSASQVNATGEGRTAKNDLPLLSVEPASGAERLRNRKADH